MLIESMTACRLCRGSPCSSKETWQDLAYGSPDEANGRGHTQIAKDLPDCWEERTQSNAIKNPCRQALRSTPEGKALDALTAQIRRTS